MFTQLFSRTFRCSSFLLLTLLCTPHLFAARNVSRYLPFLDRPEPTVVTDRVHFGASAFLTIGSSAFRRGGGKVGIPELWGPYNLSDVIDSLAAVKAGAGMPFTNPFLLTPGTEGLVDRPVIFAVDGTVNSSGGMFEGSLSLFSPNVYLGFSIPIVRVETRARYELVTRSRREREGEFIDPAVRNLESGAVNQVERVRLAVHDEIGLRPDDWDVSGVGDLDVFLRFHFMCERTLLMRSINTNLRCGVLVPTSKTRSIDFPSSVPFMGDGHWAMYFELLPEFELKHDWRVGMMASLVVPFDETSERRLPVFREPQIYSALTGETELDLGITYKLAPYVTIENLIDGLHFHGRYTYLHHEQDTTTDKRGDCPVKSYLQLEPTETRTEQEICDNIERKENLSGYRAHYLSLQLRYNSRSAMREWPLRPNFYILVDTLLEGSGMAKTHQLTLGVDFHF